MTATPAARIALESFHGKEIIIIDLSNTRPAESIALLDIARKTIEQFAPKTALIVTDVTNATYDKASAAALKEFASLNTPFIRASAVVGADGLRGVLLHAVSMLTGRPIRSCSTRDEAFGWLARAA